MKQRVHNVRKEMHGGDSFRKISETYGGPKGKAFMQFHSTFSDDKKSQTIMGFAAPTLTDHLKYNGVSNIALILQCFCAGPF